MSEILRIDRLEAIAYWARQSLLRREMYKALQRHQDETQIDYQERRQQCWKEVESADAMTQAELNTLGREHGGVMHYISSDGRPPVQKPDATPMPTNGKPMTEAELKKLKGDGPTVGFRQCGVCKAGGHANCPGGEWVDPNDHSKGHYLCSCGCEAAT